jgi:hypothetical protein
LFWFNPYLLSLIVFCVPFLFTFHFFAILICYCFSFFFTNITSYDFLCCFLFLFIFFPCHILSSLSFVVFSYFITFCFPPCLIPQILLSLIVSWSHILSLIFLYYHNVSLNIFYFTLSHVIYNLSYLIAALLSLIFYRLILLPLIAYWYSSQCPRFYIFKNDEGKQTVRIENLSSFVCFYIITSCLLSFIISPTLSIFLIQLYLISLLIFYPSLYRCISHFILAISFNLHPLSHLITSDYTW